MVTRIRIPLECPGQKPGQKGQYGAGRRRGKEGTMGIGASVLLIAVGAILTFATRLDTSRLGFDAGGVSFGGIDVDAVGVILMVAGGLGLVLTVLLHAPRRREPSRPSRAPYERTAAPYAPHGQAGYAPPHPAGYAAPPPAGHHPHDPYGQ
jgi:hypothetical protein